MNAHSAKMAPRVTLRPNVDLASVSKYPSNAIHPKPTPMTVQALGLLEVSMKRPRGTVVSTQLQTSAGLRITGNSRYREVMSAVKMSTVTVLIASTEASILFEANRPITAWYTGG